MKFVTNMMNVLLFFIVAQVCVSRSETLFTRRYVDTVQQVVLLNPYEAPYLPKIVLKIEDGKVKTERKMVKMPFRPAYSLSSGVLIRKDGIILTAAHCVKDTSLLRVQMLDGRVYRAAVLTADVDLDLALIKIVPSHRNKFLVARIGKERAIGWPVYAVGNPLGLPWLITSGIISGYLDLELLSDTVINPGSSGGGLFDATTGRLQGITVGTRGPVKMAGFMGHSVSVRISTIKAFLERNLPLCG